MSSILNGPTYVAIINLENVSKTSPFKSIRKTRNIRVYFLERCGGKIIFTT